MTKRRECVLEKLGGKCVKCGTDNNLHLHHIKYAKDSIKWDVKGDFHKRAVEALKHPERFELLCQYCHAKHHDRREIMNTDGTVFRKAKRLRMGKSKRMSREAVEEMNKMLYNIKKYDSDGKVIYPYRRISGYKPKNS